MKKLFLLLIAFVLVVSTLQAQDPIEVNQMATFNAYSGSAPDSSIPYFGDLGVRRVIVADADGDGNQEILSNPWMLRHLEASSIKTRIVKVRSPCKPLLHP